MAVEAHARRNSSVSFYTKQVVTTQCVCNSHRMGGKLNERCMVGTIQNNGDKGRTMHGEKQKWKV